VREAAAWSGWVVRDVEEGERRGGVESQERGVGVSRMLSGCVTFGACLTARCSRSNVLRQLAMRVEAMNTAGAHWLPLLSA